tara:strand:- start:3785 stop:5032 length:1248 start_codon:yes stop_codon:yes gene_type:complete
MNHNSFKKKSNCRLCQSADLVSVFKLASTPPANAFVTKEKLQTRQKKYPLEIFFCNKCFHVQLTEVVDPNELFENYVYVSGTSDVFVNHFFNYAKDIVQRFNPSTDHYVLDIGSNDGTLLKFFKSLGYSVIGIDPAKEISKKATEEGINTINGFFNLETSQMIEKKYSKASVITANNVFAHCDDLSGMTEAISNLLSPGGIFVFEVSYLVDVYQKTLFDTIYHEHLSYHSVSPLMNFFKSKKMELIDVKKVNTHGGSIRCVVKNKDDLPEINDSVKTFIDFEKSLSFNKSSTFVNFAKQIKDRKKELNEFLYRIKSEGKSIAGYGAPAKATTLMYEFGLNNDILDFIVDDSPLKQELFSPGIHIPIYSSSFIDTLKPDYLLILAWNFSDSIINKNRKFHESGGKFIIPMPKFEVI